MATMSRSGQYSVDDCKMPGFTGHMHLVKETFGRTPVMAQLSTADPTPGDFLYATTKGRPVSTPERDPCNFPETYIDDGEVPNLWPRAQDAGRQASAKPASSHLTLGDTRLNPFSSAYSHEYGAPLPGGDTLRSPLRSKVPRQAGDFAALYASACRRVDDGRLENLLEHMRDRLQGKLSNRNDNAFKLRRLFKMYDKNGTGMINTEDFRVMTESVGIQLDDDSLLALFNRYDKEACGTIEYMTLMRDVLDDDMFAQYRH